MPDKVPRGRYRRLARECLEIADIVPAGEGRAVLLEMAQVWQRLANTYLANTYETKVPESAIGPTPVRRRANMS